MIALGFELEYTGVARMGARTWNKIKRNAYRDVAEWWHTQRRPRHFTTQGAREYGYKKRAGEQASGMAFWRSYTGRKRKKWGHSDPMRWSSALMKESEKKNIVAKSTFSRITVRGRVLNFRTVGPNKINLRAEMEIVTERERRMALEVAQKSVNDNLPRRNRHNMSVSIAPLGA